MGLRALWLYPFPCCHGFRRFKLRVSSPFPHGGFVPQSQAVLFLGTREADSRCRDQLLSSSSRVLSSVSISFLHLQFPERLRISTYLALVAGCWFCSPGAPATSGQVGRFLGAQWWAELRGRALSHMRQRSWMQILTGSVAFNTSWWPVLAAFPSTDCRAYGSASRKRRRS